MMIFKKVLPRRTFLHGMGAALALPLMDGMVPAFAKAQGSAQSPTRLSFLYVPNGIIMDKWTPAAVGTGFAMTPVLAPLAPFQDKLLVLSGLVANGARALAGEGAGEHARASATFLSGVHPKKTEGSDLRAGISVDQIVAQHLAGDTQLASLEVAIDSTDVVGTCDTGYSCAYSNTLCWRTETTPIPMENQPRAVFERLFGDSDSTEPAERLARIQRRRSILDSLVEDTAHLASGLDPSDRAKLNEYTDACVLSGEDAVNTRGRWLSPRPLDCCVWRRDQRRQSAPTRQPAGASSGWGVWPAQGGPSHSVSSGDASHQSVSDAAGQTGHSAGEVR